VGSISRMADIAKHRQSGPAANEAVRVGRIREDARRPISVNLAEGIALSHKLMRFTGTALKG
jgi:hypothetical protein